MGTPKYFSFDGKEVRYHTSMDDARKTVKAAIDYCEDCANYGWDHPTPVWGEVRETLEEVDGKRKLVERVS